MAIMAPHIQIVKRSDGRSSVAFAAYRAAALLHDERIDRTHDYTRKSGVIHTEILAPEHAPDWVRDRQRLWNEIELASKRQDAQVAREFMLPLPHELSDGQRLALVRDFAAQMFVAKGMIADIAIHLPDRHSDQRNHHAHITCTMRHVTKDGFGKQAREWNDDFAGVKKLYALRQSGKALEAEAFEKELRKTRPIFDWREQWAGAVNRHLAKAGLSHRIDHRSWAAQGIEREPEKHIGVDATQLERKGEQTRAGDERRDIQERNAALSQLEHRAVENAHALELLARGMPVSHTQAKALDRTREALAQLDAFDQGHGQINHLNRQISKALSGIRHFENRKNYALRLTVQMRENFDSIYAGDGKRALEKFKTDIRKQGIAKAANNLQTRPARYGKLSGWQLGRTLYLSPERERAAGLLTATAEIARQTYYMTRKVRAQDAPLHTDLKRRLARLKAQQQDLMQYPPEGRLIVQRAIYETARGLDEIAWKLLTRQQRFHVMQARQIMKDEHVRDWADRQAQRLIASELAPAPSKAFMTGLLTKPIDLTKISPDLKKAELDRRYEEIAVRHKENLAALAAAKKAAESGLRVIRTDDRKDRSFTALLIRSTGIDHLIEAIAARQRRAIDQSYAAAKRAAESTHRAELGALQAAYGVLHDRITQRLEAAKSKEQLRQEQKDLAQMRKRAKAFAAVPRTTIEEIRRRREEAMKKSRRKGTGYRRNGRKPPGGDDD